jgi:hypothetical protein
MAYEVNIYDNQSNCLGSFLAVKLAQSNVPDSVGTLQIFTGTYARSGVIHGVKVYSEDGVLYAQWDVTYQYPVVKGQGEKDSIIHIYAISLVDRPVTKVCTCGGWVTYGKDSGLHAFHCDVY